MHNFTAYLISYGNISMFGAQVTGPRLGVCAANLTLIDSAIDSSGFGCRSDEGLGRGHQSGRCAGSGGAHSGRGGYGGGWYYDDVASNQVVSQCKDHYPDHDKTASATHFEGSGGASGAESDEAGGAGGGIVRINVLENTVLERSLVLANGEKGQVSGMGTASGGGAGGSISIVTRNLRGDSKVEARGGSGSEGGGGGGSGGILVVNYLRGYSSAA